MKLDMEFIRIYNWKVLENTSELKKNINMARHKRFAK